MTDLLEGVRVLELAPLLSGAVAGMNLADLGADVIKVEPPGGDLLRHVFGNLAPGFSPAFVQLNRGKRSVTADLASQDDRDFVAELARDCDVMLAGYAPPALTRWGLDHEALDAAGLVYCQISGFGAETVYRDQPAHGLTMTAVAGAAHPDAMGDSADGVAGDGTAAIAVAHAAVEHTLAALLRRARTGKGCYLDVSGAEAMLASDLLRVTYATNAQRPGVDAEAAESLLRGPQYAVHRTADGRAVAFAGVEPRQWQRFSAATGVVAPEDLPGLFASKPLADWLELGREHRLALAPAYRDPQEARSDPGLIERGAFLDAESAGYGEFTYLAPPARVDRRPFDPGSAPAPGADTAAVRAELAARREDLR